MEPHSQDNDKARSILEEQLIECYGRAVYSRKAHEICADILTSRLPIIMIWQIILSAIIIGGFIAAIFLAGKIGAVLGIIASTVLLSMDAYIINYDPDEFAWQHGNAASKYWKIRKKYLSLIADLRIGKSSIDALQTRRDELLDEINPVFPGKPDIKIKAYRKAWEALQTIEDMTFTDDEIAAFLPDELKKRNDSNA